MPCQQGRLSKEVWGVGPLGRGRRGSRAVCVSGVTLVQQSLFLKPAADGGQGWVLGCAVPQEEAAGGGGAVMHVPWAGGVDMVQEATGGGAGEWVHDARMLGRRGA